jgi:hypothetical protein
VCLCRNVFLYSGTHFLFVCVLCFVLFQFIVLLWIYFKSNWLGTGFLDLINVDVCIYVRIYVCMHVCMYVFMYVSKYTCMYVCMYIRICKYIVCMYVNSRNACTYGMQHHFYVHKSDTVRSQWTSWTSGYCMYHQPSDYHVYQFLNMKNTRCFLTGYVYMFSVIPWQAEITS